MYDTLHLYLPAEALTNHTQLNNIPIYLSKVKESVDMETGEVNYYGNLKNMKVSVFSSGLTLKGSICKYYLNDNFQTLGRSDVKKCIESLSDALHLPIGQARINRIDIAQNFIVRHPESVYYSYLGRSRYYKRLLQPDGVYYTSNKRQLLFYGKVIEQKVKGLPIPEMYKNRNVLRYELRLLRKIPNLFNMASLTASTLFEEKFYMAIINKWKEEYFNISKETLLNFDLLTMNSMKDFDREIYRAGLLSKFGSESKALEAVELAKKKGIFQNKMQVKRVRDRIREITSITATNTQIEEIEELDKKVKEAVRYYR